MSTMEVRALDMSTILLQAYEVADLINSSHEVAQYLHWKQQIEEDEEVQRMRQLFARKKELYDECQRFGHFHPNYHEALEAVQKIQEELDQLEIVREYKHAEERLDDLLYTVSSTIASAVSDSIKVPSNKLLPDEGGCTSGGSCSGKCS